MYQISACTFYRKYIFALLSGLPLFYSLFKIPKCLRTERALEILYDLSVIIPARNEESTIGTLLKSLKEQPWQPKEIIVVDDYSTDNTSDIAKEFGAVVLKTPELPHGWTGKNWACSIGAHYASGGYFLFIDSDVHFEKWGLIRIAAEYYHNRGVLSVLPFNRVEKVYQQFLSVFNIVTLAGVINGVLKVKKTYYGLFGPSVLCAREDYFTVGGHEAVRGSPVEHLKLAQRFKKNSIPLHVFSGQKTLTTIPYPGGIGNLISGWSRISVSGALSGSHSGLILSIAWISGALGSTFGLFGKNTFTVRISSLLTYGFYSVFFYSLLRKLGSYKVWTAIFYPLHIIFFTGVCSISLFQMITGKYGWKGRKSAFYR
ncbi:MAG: glycosyltransferase [Chitinispirillaceae bacterium]|nr:glycosyltransferase [Chitinispirillaceae bacterium]